MAPAHPPPFLFIELGSTIVALALLARLASRWSLPAIPLYLLAGLAFGEGRLVRLPLSQEFIHVGAQIGVLLLLFMLGLEYTGSELKESLRAGLPGGIADLLLNFPPGLLAGFLLHWSPLAALLLGGVTYISSSGIVAKALSETRLLGMAETRSIVSILVLEDLAMAVYLPVAAALLAGGGPAAMARSVAFALVAVLVVLFVAVRYGDAISRWAAHESDEIILLTTFGAVLLVAGAAEYFQVSAAIGAFLVGIAVSGPIREQSHRLLAPLRDLFAATFFFFFGLQIDPALLPAALPAAAALAAATALTKMATGYWSTRRVSRDRRVRLHAGMALVARGEFSIVIAGLGSAVEPELVPLAAAYVLTTAILGPLLARERR
jgi:CPA2 family monovalent cation:H+ antiporter-2